METKSLAVHNVYSGYGKTDIIKNISLEAKPGEVLAITGPNGCGKTTLLKAMACLLAYRGSIALEGIEASSLPRKTLARKIALLSQSSGTYFPFSVYDTAALGRFPHSASPLNGLSAEDKKIIDQVLDRLELLEIKGMPIHELSGGQLQRVFLARALIQDPGILLLDEPTNHLDLKHQVEFLEYISLWAKENKRTVIAVLHDLNLVRRYADTIALLHNGTLASIGNCETVLSGTLLKEIYGIDISAFMLESLRMWRKTEKPL